MAGGQVSAHCVIPFKLSNLAMVPSCQKLSRGLYEIVHMKYA